jgi:general secretion pathway protein K
MRRNKHRFLRDAACREGSVLLLVLWGLFFLSALIAASSTYVGSVIELARHMKQRSAGSQSAHVAVERSLQLVSADTNGWDGFGELWHQKEEFEWSDVEGGAFAVAHTSIGESGSVQTNFGLIDEDGKINVNMAERGLLQALLRREGRLSAGEAESLAACIIDWRDPDDDVLTGGAENGYYQGLSSSYSCRNGPMRILRELLLVKGMDCNVLDRVSPHLTVYGSGKINLNTAGKAVLSAMAEAAGGRDSAACVSLADKVIAARAGGNDFSGTSAAGVISSVKASSALTAEEEVLLSGMMRHGTLRSSCFGGIAMGRASAGGAVSEIEFIFDREQKKIVYWREK